MKLTRRQREVFQRLVAGRSNREIAADLKVSEQAVKDHVSSLYKHFGVGTRALLVRLGLTLEITGSATSAESWLSYLFVDAPLHLAVLRGPDHIVEVANTLFRLAAGVEVVGRPAREAFQQVLGSRILDLLDHVYRTGERLALSELPVEWENGDGVSAGYMNVVLEPLRDDDGRTIGLFVLVHDVTDTVRGRSENDLAIPLRSTILSRIELGVIIIDREGRPILVNDAARRAIASTVESSHPLLPQLAARWRFADTTGQPLSPERMPLTLALRGETIPRATIVAEHRAGGERFVIEVAAAPLLDADGNVRAAIATFSDRIASAGHPALLELTERSAQALRWLREVAMNTGTAFDRGAIANIVANLVRWIIKADAAAIFVTSERTGTLRLLADDNLITRPRVIEVPFGLGVSGVAYATGAPVRVPEYATWSHALPELIGVIQSGMAVPMLCPAGVIGALAVHTIAQRVFTDEEEWVLTRIATETAGLINGHADVSR